MPVEFLETSVVVRYLTNDPPEMGERAANLIASGARLCISDAALAEVAHVLRTVYGIERERVVDLLQALIRDDAVIPHMSSPGLLVDGLEWCRPSGRVSVPDALIWAAAAAAGADSVVYSFDRRFPSAGIDLREPPAV